MLVVVALALLIAVIVFPMMVRIKCRCRWSTVFSWLDGFVKHPLNRTLVSKVIFISCPVSEPFATDSVLSVSIFCIFTKWILEVLLVMNASNLQSVSHPLKQAHGGRSFDLFAVRITLTYF